MANNIIKRIWNQNKMVQIEDLKGMAFQAEDGGHTFEIYGIDEAGETVTLTGTPSGVFLRPDNTDVVLDCSVSDGVVSATLPDECYDVPGRGGLTVFITADGKKTALYAAVVTVSRTSSGNVAPPATQTVVDLVNAISAAVATIPASYSALMADIAPTYSDSALYAVGQYAWYDGDLKRCIVPITTAESYTAAHWTSAVLGNDVSDLKSALSGISKTLTDADSVDYYYVNASTGVQTYSGNFRRYLFRNIGYFSVTCTVYGDTPYAAIAFYNSDTPSAESFISAVPITERNQIATYSGNVPKNAKTIAVINRNASYDSPAATLVVNDAKNAQYRLDIAEPKIDQLEDDVVYNESISDAYYSEHMYIKMADGSRNISSNFTSYYFKNRGYDEVSATVYISSTQAAIAFFNNDDIEAENAYIGGYQTGNKNTVTTFITTVPSGTKVIVISCRTAAYATPSANLHMQNAVLKKKIIDDNDFISFNNTSESIHDFAKRCVVDIHQGYTKDGEATNTLGAFYDAYLNGATSFEADARKASDDVWVCCHDTTVTGIDEDSGTTVTYTVATTPSTTLQKVILDSDSKYGAQKVPTVAQVMNLAYKTGMILNLDMKDIRNNESQGAAIGASLARLAHDCGLSGNVIYAPNGGGIDTVNAVLAIDPDARFIDTPLRWQAAGISGIDDYQNRIIGYIAYADFSQEVLGVVRTLGCLLAVSGIDTQAKFNEMAQYHPNLCEFVGSADFRTILKNYLASLPG